MQAGNKKRFVQSDNRAVAMRVNRHVPNHARVPAGLKVKAERMADSSGTAAQRRYNG